MDLGGVEKGGPSLIGIPGVDKTTKVLEAQNVVLTEALKQAEKVPTAALKLGIIRFGQQLYQGLGRILTDRPRGTSNWE